MVLALALAIPLGYAGLDIGGVAQQNQQEGAPMQQGTAASYAVQQGADCFEAVAITSQESVREFYDYRTPLPDNAYTNATGQSFSSEGTTELQEPNASAFFLHQGPRGNLSLVAVHGALNETSQGGAATFDISGLPENGNWTVRDDEYDDESSVDNWSHEDATASVDWTWGEARTDGFAFSGLGENFTVTIDPAFNENASLYGTYYDGVVENWTVVSNDTADGVDTPEETYNRTDLDLTENVTVSTEECPIDTQGQAGVTGDDDTDDGDTGIGDTVGGGAPVPDDAAGDAGDDGAGEEGDAEEGDDVDGGEEAEGDDDSSEGDEGDEADGDGDGGEGEEGDEANGDGDSGEGEEGDEANGDGDGGEGEEGDDANGDGDGGEGEEGDEANGDGDGEEDEADGDTDDGESEEEDEDTTDGDGTAADGGDEDATTGGNAPVVNSLMWNRMGSSDDFVVEWAVSDQDGDLSEVTVELQDGSSVLASNGAAVSGTSEVGDTQLTGAGADNVQVTVTDSNGNQGTDSYSIGPPPSDDQEESAGGDQSPADSSEVAGDGGQGVDVEDGVEAGSAENRDGDGQGDEAAGEENETDASTTNEQDGGPDDDDQADSSGATVASTDGGQDGGSADEANGGDTVDDEDDGDDGEDDGDDDGDGTGDAE